MAKTTKWTREVKTENPQTLVNFFIVGQPKSGTTALAQFLDQHPKICMANPKEPSYFATDILRESEEFHGRARYFKVRTPEEYAERFKTAEPDQLLGDASTSYLYSSEAAKNIYNYNPEAKIIALLRNPVDFLYSLHRQYVNETVENETDFKKALALEAKRKQGENIPSRVRVPSYLYYSERIDYYQQLKRYFDLFPKDQICILITEQFKENNQKWYQEVVKFLELDISFTPNFKLVNPSKKPRSRILNKLVNIIWVKNLVHGVLGPRLYNKLQDLIMGLIYKKASRRPLDKEFRKKLREKFKPKVERANSLVSVDLLEVWGY